MKISKLFHWLYAFLMFLPILALAPSLFYFAFNQQSQNYTDVQVTETYEYETNEVNSVDDLLVGNIYKLYLPRLQDDLFVNNELILQGYTYDITIISDTNNIHITDEVNIDIYYSGSNLDDTSYVNASNTMGSLYDTNDMDYATPIYLLWNVDITLQTNDITIFFSASDYLGEKNVEIVRSEQSPMNIFYTAVNYVYDMPVFSWAKNSFLALPITYVTGLFGMASTNVVNYYLSYWLAISIVYLVFDLVMYVPLLVHRWIDKGMIE